MPTVHLTTSDGHHLTGDLAQPEGTARGGVVVCHPHPQHGGNRFNPVVDALFTALPPAGFVTLRFDFRAAFDHGVGERLDVVAALDELARHTPQPLWLTGYSFGAVVALSTADPRVGGIAAVAPPLAMAALAPPAVPSLVLTPRHDQFSPPASTEPIVASWPDSEFAVVEAADHFLAGHTADVAARVVTWLSNRP